MREIDDIRTKTSEYEIAAIITACIAMSLFKTESRNGYNNKREDLQFRQNYKKIFGFDMPHGDTVQDVIKLLDYEQIEQLKQTMIRTLLERKIFQKSRYRNRWYRIAIDGSGVVSFSHKHCEQCHHRTSKTGKTTYFHTVLDARLITPNGFSISLASEWIENPKDGNYDKPDCERKAFKRLAEKLKKAYPRLPIIILADGLYPYEDFFEICQENQWYYCITFKEGNLPTVWEEVYELQQFQTENQFLETRYRTDNQDSKTVKSFRWVDNINYKGHNLNWLECVETKIWNNGMANEKTETKCFVHVTNLAFEAKVF